MSIKPCKLSPFAPQSNGYAQVRLDGKLVLHHRLVYVQSKGLTLESIAGIVVRHTCDVRNLLE